MLSFLWIAFTFILGLLASQVKLPPLIGYLLSGFLLHALGVNADQTLNDFSEIGISLLLFTIGLKLNLSTLAKKEVLGVSLLHTLCGFIFVFLLLYFGFDHSYQVSSIIAFALTFSSTVYVFKVLEERGDFYSTYGKTAIGILIIQDLLAVIFMVAAKDSLPSAWFIGVLLLLWPIKVLIHRILDKIPRGELLILYGLTLTLGFIFLFEAVNLKGDLGALLAGVLIAKHKRASEVGKALLSIKDLFILGFFLSIGMFGFPTWSQVWLALSLTLILPFRSALYFFLFTKSGLRSRTAFLSATSLLNYSEFGLILGAASLNLGYIEASWLTTLALSLSFSFIISALINQKNQEIFNRYSQYFNKFDKQNFMNREPNIILADANVMILGLGRVGRGAMQSLIENTIWRPIGFDINEDVVDNLKEKKLNIQHGNVTSPDFWNRIDMRNSSISLVLLAMPLVNQNLEAAKYLRENGYRGKISSIAKYSNEIPILEEAGINSAFNLYDEAGVGFAQNASLLCQSEK